GRPRRRRARRRRRRGGESRYAASRELPLPAAFLDGQPRLKWAPPRLVLAIPGDGAAHPLVEADLRFPAEFAADLAAVEQVAPVVAGAVGDVALQARRAVEEGEDVVGDLLDAPLDAAADVVELADAAPAQD